MGTLNPDRWRAVSPYLDQALTLPEGAREKWLAILSERDPTLAADLRSLLQEHASVVQSEFLERTPGVLPGEIAHEGETIGAYTLISAIGVGGMGTVWLARRSDGRFERSVAIKFPNVSLSGREGQERFKREGSVLGRLAHPHIAALLDAGLTPSGQPYLVLEHVDGEAIDVYCDRLRLDLRARVRLVLDVLAAVAHAHANLIVHRDLKPSNVLVTTDGQVKLLDFGIAKLMEDEATSGTATLQTREGAGPMTPAYAAPEQLTGAPVTTATDVYALGVLLYVLLGGQHPAGSGVHTPADLVKAIVDAEPSRLSTAVSPGRKNANDLAAVAAARSVSSEKLSRLLHGDLDTIVAKALKKDPRERYASVTAMADDLHRSLRNEPIAARPDALAYRAAKFARRNKGAVLAAASIALVLVLGATLSTWGLVRARRAEKVAATEAVHAKRQAAIAEAMNRFLNEDLLASVAPSAQRGHGRDVRMREVLDTATSRIDAAAKPRGSLAEDPFVESSIRMTLGRTYRDLGEFEIAEAQYRRAIELRRQIPDAEVEYGAALGEMGILSQSRGRYAAAESLLALALNAFVQANAPVDSVRYLIPAVINLANLYENEERYARAESLYVRLLEPTRRLVGEEGTLHLSIMSNLANIYQAFGRYAETESLRTRLFAIRLRVDGEDAPSTLRTMNNLAHTYASQGYLDKAEELLARTLEGKRRVFGPEHPSTINTLSGLASLFDTRGEHAEAEHRHREALAICDRTLGSEHPLTAQMRTSVAFSCLKQGRTTDALEFASQAAAICRAKFGMTNEATLNAMLVAALCDASQGRLSVAADSLLRIVDTIHKRPVTDPLLRLHAEAHCGLALAKQGRRAEAEAALQPCLARLPVWEAESRSLLRDAITVYEAWHASDAGSHYGKQADALRARLP